MKAILKKAAEATVTGVANIVVMVLIIPITLICVIGGLGASIQHPIKKETEK